MTDRSPPEWRPHGGTRASRAARWIVGAAAVLVPRRRRGVWRRQWHAELEHGASVGKGSWRLIRLACGAVPHALYLRTREVTMRGLMADLRHSVRTLWRQPGFTALTLATFAVGIGSATAIFSLAEALVLRPYPFDEADRLVQIYSTQPRRGSGRVSVSYPDYADFAGRDDLFSATSFYLEESRDVSGGPDPERVRVTSVHRDFFQTLRSPTVLGRLFAVDDHDPGEPLTAIVSESFWAGPLGADSAAIGRTIRLDGVPHTVIGVVADRFGWPAGTDVWVPLQWGGAVPEHADVRTNHTWQVVARLRSGVEVDEASEQIRAMARTIYSRPGIDERDVGTEAMAVSLRIAAAGDDPGPLFATLGGAVGFVLLIVCLNASGLLLVRAWGRTRELSLRSALGAGQGRLRLIVLGESALLALVGGALGGVLGVVGLQRAFSMAPPEITALGDPGLNIPVISVGLGISLLAALVAGGVPAARASRLSVAEALKEGAAHASPGRSSTRMRRGLVIAEVALSLALLVGAGLTVRGFQRQIATEPGFDASDLLAFTVRLPEARYGDDALVAGFYREATERLERHPEIVSASVSSRLPLDAGGLSLGRSFIFDGDAPPPDGPTWAAAWIEVDPEWFETLGIQPADGRAFGSGDRADTELVAIVNERMASRMSPDEPIVGRRIRSVYDEDLPRTVVGVVPDVQIRGVSRAQRQPVVFVPRTQSVRRSMGFLVRTTDDPSGLVPTVRRTMSELDPDVALDGLGTLRDAHAADLAGIRFLTTLFGTLGLLALILAVGGVYGLVSHSVAQRRQEIGVRMAMGASITRVRRSVLGESALLAGVGLAIGLVLAYGAGRVLAAAMSGVAVLEVSTYVGVVVVLAGAVLAATWFPAVRATRVDPVEALRSE